MVETPGGGWLDLEGKVAHTLALLSQTQVPPLCPELPSLPLPHPGGPPLAALHAPLTHTCSDLGTHLSALNSSLVCHRRQRSLKQ